MDSERQSSKVLIIGGGLGGLLLAQGLCKFGIPFHLYERDERVDFRPQGYRIRISEHGFDALKANLTSELWDQFELNCAVTAPGGTSFDPISAEEQHVQMGERPHLNAKSYTADRTVLRRLLLTGLEPCVTFGAEFSRFEWEPAGRRVSAYFRSGSIAYGSLLIGSDGIHSSVRKQYNPRARLVDTMGRLIYGKTLLTEELRSRFPAAGLKNMTILKDRTNGDDKPLTLLLEPIIFLNRDKVAGLPDDYVYWVLCGRKELFDDSSDVLHRLTREEIKELSLDLTAAWAPSFRTLFELQDTQQTSGLRVSSLLPIDMTDDRASLSPALRDLNAQAQVTLLGDAAHATTAAGGFGAVTAMRDAGLLAAKLKAAHENETTLDEAIIQYEAAMRVYARETMEMAGRGGKNIFGQPDYEDCPLIDV